MFSTRCGGSEKPPDEEECDPPPGSESCNVPAWIVSDWSGCDGKCGELTIYFLSHFAISTSHLQIRQHPVVENAKQGVSRVCTFPNFSNKLACPDAHELSAATDAVRCTHTKEKQWFAVVQQMQ